MKIKEGFILRTICGEHIVVGEGLAQVNFNKMLSLNESAAYLWKEAEGKEFTQEDLVKLLLDKYEVSQEQAAADVEKLTATWIQEGVVEA
ncbi:MAG: PqqD family protein [Bacteroidales bacterium]|nr:PqqD family protein [Bacteroidales bacterium]MBR0286881.1 PqqD family protein [Bacteroidales bacterium]